MTTFRVVFANGEKKELIVDADTVSTHEETMYFDKGKRAVAAIPCDRVLYAAEIQEP